MNHLYSATEHLAKTVWLSRFSWRNRMAMFSAYFDESGHPDDSDFLVVAGCIADVDQWCHLEREWRSALSPSDPDNAPDFHFAESRDDTLKATLARIVCRRVEKSFATAIPLRDYNAINQKYILAEAFGYPYPVAARSCIAAVRDWADYHGIATPIEYVFEHGAKHRGQLEWLAEKDQFVTPIYKKKRECKTLQVGDLIAGELRRVLDLQLRTKSVVASPLLDIVEQASHSWGVMDLKDPDKLPYVLKIPSRDPAMRYQFRIMRRDGKRLAVVHSWSKHETNPKLKKAIRLPSSDDTPVTVEVVNARLREYESDDQKRNRDESVPTAAFLH